MPTSYEAQQRQERALRLRDNGATYEQIAMSIGYAHSGAARRAVLTAMIRAGRENEIADGRAVRLRTGATTATVVVDNLVGFHTDSNMSFGIEIECIGLTFNGVVNALRSINIVCENAGYTHTVMNTWKVVPDGSVSNGCEVVSPPLRGNDGLDEVRSVMKVLRDAGARINVSCGMHIHIGVDGYLSQDEQARLIVAHQMWQPAFDALLTERRVKDGRWAKKRSAMQAQTLSEQWRTMLPNQISRNSNRYAALNVNSFHKYGTFEFRSHHGSLNGKNATAWIALHLAFIEAVKANSAFVCAASLRDVLSIDEFSELQVGRNESGYYTQKEARVVACKKLVNVLQGGGYLRPDVAEFLYNRAGNLPTTASALSA